MKIEAGKSYFKDGIKCVRIDIARVVGNCAYGISYQTYRDPGTDEILFRQIDTLDRKELSNGIPEKMWGIGVHTWEPYHYESVTLPNNRS